MEPLKPHEKQAILADNPQAEPGDIEEYERLLSEMFSRDPDEASAAPEKLVDERSRSLRLETLHKKLFPNK